MSMDASSPMNDGLSARLDHICLQSQDPRALSEFYGQHLGYDVQGLSRGTFLAEGEGRRILFEEGENRKLAFCAFDVEDDDELDRLAARIASAGVRSEPFESPFFTSRAVAVRGPDGDTFAFGTATRPRTKPNDLSDPKARLQHVVMASTNAERVTAFVIDVLGFRLSDSVVSPDGRMRTAFMRCSHEHHSFAVFQAPENRLDHHCYEIPDWNAMRDWADRFGRERVPLKWGPGRHGPGSNLFMFVHDRDGNWVELSAELELIHNDRPAGVWAHEEYTANSWGVGLLRS